MPRTSDVGLYRRLIAAQRDGTFAVSRDLRERLDVPASADEQAARRFAAVRAAMADADARLAAGDPALSVLLVEVEGADDARATPAVRALRRRHPRAVAVLVVLGDLDDACARRGAAGYARLLVRAGAAAEAGRSAAVADGFTARLDHVAGRAAQLGEPPMTPLCTVVLHGADVGQVCDE
jgi:hypothetical protein